MIDANLATPTADGKKAPRARAPKKKPSALEKLTAEELVTLRLDETARAEYDAVVQRFIESRNELLTFQGEEVASMADSRFDELTAAETQQHSAGMAVVYFLAPRILRLKDGEAKRKWRSFLAKLRKDEKLT